MRSAATLDQDDQLAALRECFVAPGADTLVAYLDGNSLGRPLIATEERLRSFVRDQWGNRLIRSWDEGWMDEPTVLGDRLAEVALGAGPGQTFIGDSTSVMLYKLVRAALSRGGARREIVIDRDNFPTDRFILEGIAHECGGTIRWIDTDPAAGVDVELLAPVLSERTAVVVLSHVAYRSGHLADAAAVTAAVHDVGALMLWDLCHSAGSVPIGLDDWDVDLAVGCTYKYLNGGPGSPAFGYVNRRLHGALEQPIWGWMGSASPFAMTDRYAPADGIRRFLSGTPSILAMQPMKDMIELIAEAGIDRVRHKSIDLTGFAIELHDALLAPHGVRLASPRDAGRRGSHVTLDHPLFEQVTRTLWAQGVVPDFRPPHGLRIGLSPLSTSFAELEAGMRAIEVALRAAL